MTDINHQSFNRQLDFLSQIWTVIFVRHARAIRKEPLESLFKLNIRNLNLKTQYSRIRAYTFGTTSMNTIDFKPVNVHKN